MGRGGETVQVVVQGDSLVITCAASGQASGGWLCRLPVLNIIGFDYAGSGGDSGGGPLSRLFMRKGGNTSSPQRSCAVEMHVQREGKIAKVTLAGTAADAESLMCDVTTARRSASPTFDVAL